MDNVVRCLWIGRDIPVPESTGDRVYSRRLAMALANAEFQVRYLGLATSDAGSLEEGNSTFSWIAVKGSRRSYQSAVFSALPLAAAALNIGLLRDRLDAELSKTWDVIVLDNYATAWALGKVRDYRKRHLNRTLLVYVSHNHESALAKSLHTAYRGSTARRLVLLANFFKIRRTEKILIREANLVSSITEEDAKAIRPLLRAGVGEVILTPGFSGKHSSPRSMSSSERRVVLVGSFRWVVKQQNLRELLEAADTLFASHEIALDIIGDTPSEIVSEYEGVLRAAKFHGFVDDYSPIFQAARIAIVPESVGGGFKLKILDYIFNRLPVAALEQASAGLPASIRSNFITADNIKDLVQAIVHHIDAIDALDLMQSRAYSLASELFNWSDRGEKLRFAIRTAQAMR